MQSATAAVTPAKALKICGHDIFFPPGKSPFSAQKSVISKALIAMNKGQNALLESPTGTGKTLALLTSTLSWQKKRYESDIAAYAQQTEASSVGKCEIKSENEVEDRVKLENRENGILNGTKGVVQVNSGLFHGTEEVGTAAYSLTSAITSAHDTANKVDSDASSNVKNSDQCLSALLKPKRRRIYFCARTHSQLQQSVDELKNCHYSYVNDLKMCVLSSRKNYCINDDVLQRSKPRQGSANSVTVDESCRNLLSEGLCRFNNRHTIKRSSDDLRKTGVWDIEDAVWMGRKHKSCPYFVSRHLHQANPGITFAPYTYLLNSSIRQSTEVELRDAIVVFDEAHNIESACREVASCEAFLSALNLLSSQLRKGASSRGCGCPMSYQSLHEMVGALVGWLTDTAKNLDDNDFMQGSNNVWDGAEILAMFSDKLQLSPSSLDMFVEHFKQIVAAEEEDERQAFLDNRDDNSSKPSYINVSYDEENNVNDEEDTELVGGSTTRGMKKKGALAIFSLQLLKDLFRIFEYMLRNNAECIDSYKLVVLKNKRGRDSDITLNFWCLSAGVAFRDFKECHSVILTSGTLSPLDSFSAELGVAFPVKVETQHVIDTDSQVLATAVSRFGNIDLKCTYHFHDDMRYQDALGNSLLSIRQASTAGMLVFFPSYGLLDKVQRRWHDTGLLKALGKSVGNLNSFGEQWCSEVEDGCGVVVEPRDTKNLEDVLQAYYKRIDNRLPCVLLAVCRGKVSEGIDFADEYARTVCIVGIPFPSVMDLQVRLKRLHQDDMCQQRPFDGHLPGDKWYSQEAYRAINQAVGRCIRHVRDFGAILLLDSRYAFHDNQIQMSKWLRGKISNCDNLENALVDLRSFSHTNRLKFAEHLASWRQRHPSSLVHKSSRQSNGQPSSSQLVTDQNRKGSGVMGAVLNEKQSAVASMFNKLPVSDKVTTPQMPQSDKASRTKSVVTPATSTLQSYLSDFTLDFFVFNVASTEGGRSISDVDCRYLVSEISSWRLRSHCVTGSASSDLESIIQDEYRMCNIIAAKLPSRLSYINRYLFNRNRVFMTDAPVSNDNKTYPLSTCGASYGLSLNAWKWSDSLSSSSTTSRYRVREIWVPEDEVAYRLLEYYFTKSNTDTPMLIAATVIGASKQHFEFIGDSWISIECILYLKLHKVENIKCDNICGEKSLSSGYLSASNILRMHNMSSNENNYDSCSGLDDDVFSMCTQQIDASPAISERSTSKLKTCISNGNHRPVANCNDGTPFPEPNDSDDDFLPTTEFSGAGPKKKFKTYHYN